jgi:ribosomal protein S12 methylthiotransferase
MKYHIVTLGCPKNVVDSEGMAHLLDEQGHVAVEAVDEADVVIVNTCGFIKAARDEAVEVLRELGQHKREGQRLIAAGCMLESHPHLARRIPGVDTTISTRQWLHISEVVGVEASTPVPLPSEGMASRENQSLVHDQSGSYADWRTASVQRQKSTFPSAYLKISDGCDLRCSFCTIPAIKGGMRSKPLEMVVREAQDLVNQGVQEIVLVAQHLTRYGHDLGMDHGLVRLLDTLCAEIPHNVWVRLMYAYPHSITPRLVETMARHPQICAYLDMPLQHAHPATLRRMHRLPDIEPTRQVIAELRSAMPDIALRSTFIVGFPGETAAEFRTLLAFLEEIAFDWVGAFQYSREEGTPSAQLPGQVKPHTIERRWHELMQQQQAISLERNRRWRGRELDVLVEGEGQLDDGRPLVVGRSFREAPEIDGQVFVWGKAAIGEYLRVRITDATEYDLWGTPLSPSSAGAQ